MQKPFARGKKISEEFKNEIFPLNYDEEEKREHRNKEEKNKIRDENTLID